MSRFRDLWPGVPLAVGSALLFGISTPVAKALLGDLSPAMLAGLLYLGSGLGLLAMLQAGGRSRTAGEARLRRADLPWLGAVVLTGGVFGPLLLMSGLVATPASAASLLLNLEGVFTLSIAWVVFHENVDARIGMGALAILVASALLSWSGGGAGYNGCRDIHPRAGRAGHLEVSRGRRSDGGWPLRAPVRATRPRPRARRDGL